MDPYSSSGYRSDRARDQAKAFKTHGPAGGFLAPGFPVDTPPPPAAVAPAAGAAAGGFVAATIGALAAGGYIGYKAQREVFKWDKYAKQPFYDAAKWMPHYSDDYDYPIGYDREADNKIKWELQHLLDLKSYSDWYWNRVDEQTQEHRDHWLTVGSGDVVPSTGWYSPDWCWSPCQPPPNLFQRYSSAFGGLWNDNPGCAGHPLSTFCNQNFAATATDPASIEATSWGGGYIDVCSKVANASLFGKHFGTYWYQGLGTAPTLNRWVQDVPGTALSQNLFIPGDFTNADTASDNWLNSAAAPGSYLSFDEQLVEGDFTEMPRGRSYGGYWVPFGLNYPITVIDVLPGSPPVTVPDVVIDPGSETDPGSVHIVPPGQNPFPDASEHFEQKPRGQKIIHAGHVVINFATETNDLFQALLKGLPKKYRPKGPRGAQVPPWVVLRAIVKHWDHFDSEVALEAFVNNQIEDAIYGRYFGLKARAQRRLGVSAGLARGVRGTPYSKQFSGTQTLVVPEVHFAHGKHSVTFGDYEINLVPR